MCVPGVWPLTLLWVMVSLPPHYCLLGRTCLLSAEGSTLRPGLCTAFSLLQNSSLGPCVQRVYCKVYKNRKLKKILSNLLLTIVIGIFASRVFLHIGYISFLYKNEIIL